MNAASPRPKSGPFSPSGDNGYTAADYEMDTSAQNLHFYNEPPNFEMNLDEFEEFALDRLMVLRKIEELRTHNITGDEYVRELDRTIKHNLSPNDPGEEVSTKVQRQIKHKRDIASHFVLRSAYCRTEELRHWFLLQECHLFRHRLEHLSNINNGRGVRVWLRRNNLHFDIVGENEKERLKPYLLSIPAFGNTLMMTSAEFPLTIYYKVPFTQALDLVGMRQCYLSGGLAYVPFNKLVTIIVAKFRMALSKSLTMGSRVFKDVFENDTRLKPLLENMNEQYTGKTFNSEDNQLGDDFNDLTIDTHTQYMPLCMSRIHSGLKEDHKLKYDGRMQYGLFLKGAGLTMEQSIVFFQREFTKIMTNEQFQKGYAYNIRHIYGKEGKRQSKAAYSCSKIIMGNHPTSGQHHGCPYKHFDGEHLSSLLTKLRIGSAGDRDTIMGYKKAKQYTIACQKHFEVMHMNARSLSEVSLVGVGAHPNAWFLASKTYHKMNVEINSDKNVLSVKLENDKKCL